MAREDQRSLCLTCRHYFITYDPVRPNGCRYFDFKSTQMPCLEVQKASGEACQVHEHKEAK